MLYTLKEIADRTGLNDKSVRNTSQRLPFTATKRVGRTDLYDPETSLRIALCCKMHDRLRPAALREFLEVTEEARLADIAFVEWSTRGFIGLAMSMNVIALRKKLQAPP